MAERAEASIAAKAIDVAPQVRRRVLALEIRASRMGFAVFEDMELIDWGAKSFPRTASPLKGCVPTRIRNLLTTYCPGIAVVRERKYFSESGNKRFATILDMLRRESKQQRAKFRVISPYSLEAYFAKHGCTTKYEIATNLARRFEYLSWKLPKPRKVYESEAPIMAVFDAVATGLGFLERNADMPITS